MSLPPFTPAFQKFVYAERESRDTIDFKKAYVDMTALDDEPGDVMAGLLLSQIIYWHLPPKGKSLTRSKVHIEREGKLWLAKRRTEWWDEIRLTPRQIDRTCKRLVQCGIVETRVWKFAGDLAVHIWLNQTRFVELWEKVTDPSYSPPSPFSPKRDLQITDPGSDENADSTSVNSKLPGGDLQTTPALSPLTETPAETTPETITAGAVTPSEPDPFDLIPSARSQMTEPGIPTGTSHEAMCRALQLACVPNGDRRLLRALDGEINKASLYARENDICQAQDIYERVCGEGQVWYTTYLAEDGQGGLTKPPTPMSLVKWLWNLENMRSKLWKAEPEPKPAPRRPSDTGIKLPRLQPAYEALQGVTYGTAD